MYVYICMYVCVYVCMQVSMYEFLMVANNSRTITHQGITESLTN